MSLGLLMVCLHKSSAEVLLKIDSLHDVVYQSPMGCGSIVCVNWVTQACYHQQYLRKYPSTSREARHVTSEASGLESAGLKGLLVLGQGGFALRQPVYGLGSPRLEFRRPIFPIQP